MMPKQDDAGHKSARNSYSLRMLDVVSVNGNIKKKAEPRVVINNRHL